MSIPEDAEIESPPDDFKAPKDENKKYTWRIDLSKSEKVKLLLNQHENSLNSQNCFIFSTGWVGSRD